MALDGVQYSTLSGEELEHWANEQLPTVTSVMHSSSFTLPLRSNNSVHQTLGSEYFGTRRSAAGVVGAEGGGGRQMSVSSAGGTISGASTISAGSGSGMITIGRKEFALSVVHGLVVFVNVHGVSPGLAILMSNQRPIVGLALKELFLDILTGGVHNNFLNLYEHCCDQCRPGTFDLRKCELPGCSECFCFRVTDRCRSSNWPIQMLRIPDEAWSLKIGNKSSTNGMNRVEHGRIVHAPESASGSVLPMDITFEADLQPGLNSTRMYGLGLSYAISSFHNPYRPKTFSRPVIRLVSAITPPKLLCQVFFLLLLIGQVDAAILGASFTTTFIIGLFAGGAIGVAAVWVHDRFFRRRPPQPPPEIGNNNNGNNNNGAGGGGAGGGAGGAGAHDIAQYNQRRADRNAALQAARIAHEAFEAQVPDPVPDNELEQLALATVQHTKTVLVLLSLLFHIDRMLFNAFMLLSLATRVFDMALTLPVKFKLDSEMVQSDQQWTQIRKRESKWFYSVSSSVLASFPDNAALTIAISSSKKIPKAEIGRDVAEIIRFEKEFAQILIQDEERRNISKMYNIRRLSEMERDIFPDLNWTAYFGWLMPDVMRDYVASDPEVVLAEPAFFVRLTNLLSKTDKQIIANYVLWRYASAWSFQMDERYNDIQQAFLGKQSKSPRWKDCSSSVSQCMSYANGAMYVRKHFDKKSKTATLEMIEDAFSCPVGAD